MLVKVRILNLALNANQMRHVRQIGYGCVAAKNIDQAVG